MSLEISPEAAKQMQAALAQREKGLGIRVGVRTTGCSGLAYLIEFVDSPNPDDVCHQSNGISLYVDPKSQVYLEGTVLDYQEQELEKGFTFRNPNEKARCGCGESFTV